MPRILVVIDYYLPGYRGGGSIRTLASLVEALGDEFDFDIITNDRDWRSPLRYENVPSGEWMRVGKARVRYLSPREWSLPRLARLMRSVRYDLLYLNSVFARATIRPLLLRRLGVLPRTALIVGPRGELAAGALRSRGLLKKRLFLRAASASGLYRGALWQASTEAECEDIRRVIGADAEIVQALDPTPDYESWAIDVVREPKQAGRARLCFVSRISPVKNVHYAIELLRDVQGEVDFDLYGPIDNPDYWQQCEAAIATLPANIRVRSHGGVPHAELAPLLARCDLFLFPTLGENFGHTILEALAARAPVLISDRTPWRGLSEAGVGWDVPLEDADAFRRIVDAVVAMSESEHGAMRRRAREYALRAADPRRAIEEHRRMFRTALQGR